MSKEVKHVDLKTITGPEFLNQMSYKELDVEDNNKVSEAILEILVASENLPNKKKKVNGNNDKKCIIC